MILYAETKPDTEFFVFARLTLNGPTAEHLLRLQDQVRELIDRDEWKAGHGLYCIVRWAGPEVSWYEHGGDEQVPVGVWQVLPNEWESWDLTETGEAGTLEIHYSDMIWKTYVGDTEVESLPLDRQALELIRDGKNTLAEAHLGGFAA